MSSSILPCIADRRAAQYLFSCEIEGVNQSQKVPPSPNPSPCKLGGAYLSAGMADLQPGLCPLPYGSHMLFLAWFPCSVARAESFVASFPCGSLLALSACLVQEIGLSCQLTTQGPSGPFPCPKGEVLGLAKAGSMCHCVQVRARNTSVARQIQLPCLW